MNFVPHYVRRRIADRPNLLKILDNIGWLFFDKFLRMGVGLFIGVWVARYLGPEQFGQLSFAIAFVGLVGAIASLGLQGIVVRDLVRTPENASVTMGSAFALQIFGAFIAVCLILGSITFLRPNDALTRVIVAILSVTLLFKISSIVKYWFEAHIQSRYVVWVENTAFLIVSAFRVVLIIVKAPLVAFIWAFVAEASFAAVGLTWIYRKCSLPGVRWKVSGDRVRGLLKDSWPLMLSGVAIMVYMRIDQIMLGQIVGEKAIGIYSAAIRVSEIWYMVPTVIGASLFPTIVESKNKNELLYLEQIQNLLDFMFVISFSIGVFVSIYSNNIINILFGESYHQSANVLAVHVWAGVFVFIGVVGNKWYLIENLQHLILYRTSAGAFANVILNYFFIPKYGPIGAAVSTIVSYAISAYFMDCLSLKTRPLFLYKTKSFFVVRRFARLL